MFSKSISLKNHESYIGKKFNYLTIVKFSDKSIKDKSGDGYRAICVCDCGAEISDIYSRVLNGKRKSCGKVGCPYFHQVRVDASKKSSISVFTGHGKIYGSRWASWRLGAIARKIEFSISIEYAWSVFENQDGKCALSGVDLVFDGKWNSNKTTASLDRIDSSKGYIEGNVQWVHKEINLMKRSMSDERFIEICKSVFLYRVST